MTGLVARQTLKAQMGRLTIAAVREKLLAVAMFWLVMRCRSGQTDVDGGEPDILGVADEFCRAGGTDRRIDDDHQLAVVELGRRVPAQPRKACASAWRSGPPLSKSPSASAWRNGMSF